MTPLQEDDSEVEDSPVRPPLTTQEVDAVIGSRLAAMKSCFAAMLKGTSGPRGVLTMSWIVSGNGQVENVQTQSTDFSTRETAELTGCLDPMILALPFPSTRGGRALRVTYPFTVK